MALEDVRSQAADLGLGSAQIQGAVQRGRRQVPAFQIRTEELSTAEQTRPDPAAETRRSARRRASRPCRRASAARSPRARSSRSSSRCCWSRSTSPSASSRSSPAPVMVALIHDVADHRRHLRAARAGGDDRHGRRGPDRARVLDLRHDHHLRPHPREHPADEAGVVPDARERVAVGDDPALARDDVHHAAADHGALLLRRRDAEGLRASRCSSASAPARTRRSSSPRRSSPC